MIFFFVQIGYCKNVHETQAIIALYYFCSDNEGMRPRAATMSELEMPKRKGSHKNRNHRSHKHHHHARHLRSRGVNAQDDLEMRIRTGMQKLEEERKAYQGVLAEMDEGIGAKDLEDIASKIQF